MLPRNIDLTEHGDFRRGASFTGHLDIPIELWDEDIVTSDDYEKIKRWEKIFGRRRHENRKRAIFGIANSLFVRDLENRCCRCGKEFRLPWVRDGKELCKTCEDDIEQDCRHIKLPWTHTARFDNREYLDLFNLR